MNSLSVVKSDLTKAKSIKIIRLDMREHLYCKGNFKQNCDFDDSPYCLNIDDEYNFQCNITQTKIDSKSKLEYVIIPKGYTLYKLMTPKLPKNITNVTISNDYGGKNFWCANPKTALASLGYTKDDTYWLHVFKTLIPIRLLNLGNYYNIKKILNKLQQKIDNLQKYIASGKQGLTKWDLKHYDSLPDDKSKNNFLTSVIKDYSKEVERLTKLYEAVRLATGCEITWTEQLQIIRKYYSQNNYNNLTGNECLYLKEGNKLLCPIKININGHNHGSSKNDLNRVSIYKYDLLMMQAIAETFNVDGYINVNLPSLFHKENFIHEEIGLILSRNIVDRYSDSKYDHTNPDYDKTLQELKQKTQFNHALEKLYGDHNDSLKKIKKKIYC